MTIRTRVKANARKEIFRRISDNVFEISVREKAAENAANERVMTLIARHFGVSVKKVRIVSGHHRPNKRISIAS
ncbi:DUF167 domain-containing protein [Candidatus Kaiserbacteria bacterium]|nr:DUF167 domain-containing protein [Candidatus Kaiserbacteria bacterium]